MDTVAMPPTPLPAAPHQAWFDLHDDAHLRRHPVALRVYAKLVRLEHIFEVPRDVKVWALALQLHASPYRVQLALKLLIAHGYVIEHGRSQYNVRQLTLVATRSPAPVP